MAEAPPGLAGIPKNTPPRTRCAADSAAQALGGALGRLRPVHPALAPQLVPNLEENKGGKVLVTNSSKKPWNPYVVRRL